MSDYWAGERGHKRDMRERKMDKRSATVVFDVDGVLADNTERLKTLDRTAPDWLAFHAEQSKDPLREAEAALLNLMYDGAYNVVLLTNRPEAYRESTEDWLERHALPYHLLLMRGVGADYHTAKIDAVKALQSEGWDVALVVDDDPQHCENITHHCGVPVLYVHSGYYEAGRLDTADYVSQDPNKEAVV